MKSMTGFGQGRTQSADVSIEVSVRTVNGRFLETRFHLPREYMAFESDLRGQLAREIRRGTVDVFVSRRLRRPGAGGQVVVNKDLAKKYVDAYRRLARDLKVDDRLSVETLTRWPDLVRLEESSSPSEGERALVAKAFAEALKNCLKERRREGGALAVDLKKLLKSLDQKLVVIRSLREEANRHLRQRLEEKMAGRLKGEIDPQRLSQEIVMQVDRSDINEELQRLGEHFKNYRHLLDSREAEGKKLDFYTQELLREVNTIGSKSQVAKITQSVVEAKALIEKLREQVQNVE